jgi:small multidrug resistance pump
MIITPSHLFPFLIVVTVLLNTIAQALLKLGSKASSFNFYLLGGLAAYGLSTLFYLVVLSKANLSIAYPIVIGLTVLMTTLTSTWLLGEKVISVQWIGIGLVIAGISAIASVNPSA